VRAVVQRVTTARVTVGGETVGEIGRGLCVLLGVAAGDTPAAAATMARRLYGLRLFGDEAGVMNVAVAGVGGQVLVISQFTLLGDTSRGRRPSWSRAAPAAEAGPLVDEVVAELGRLGATVATGRFGADMLVEIVNDGPVTVIVEV
jgi:D-aminoacyl-tRNA deacylase